MSPFTLHDHALEDLRGRAAASGHGQGEEEQLNERELRRLHGSPWRGPSGPRRTPARLRSDLRSQEPRADRGSRHSSRLGVPRRLARVDAQHVVPQRRLDHVAGLRRRPARRPPPPAPAAAGRARTCPSGRPRAASGAARHASGPGPRSSWGPSAGAAARRAPRSSVGTRIWRTVTVSGDANSRGVLAVVLLHLGLADLDLAASASAASSLLHRLRLLLAASPRPGSRPRRARLQHQHPLLEEGLEERLAARRARARRPRASQLARRGARTRCAAPPARPAPGSRDRRARRGRRRRRARRATTADTPPEQAVPCARQEAIIGRRPGHAGRRRSARSSAVQERARGPAAGRGPPGTRHAQDALRATARPRAGAAPGRTRASGAGARRGQKRRCRAPAARSTWRRPAPPRAGAAAA